MFHWLLCCESAGWRQAEKAFNCCRENRNSHTVRFHPTSVVTVAALFSEPVSKSLLSCSARSKWFPLSEYLCGLFSDNPQIWEWQSVPGFWICTLMVVWSDKASVLESAIVLLSVESAWSWHGCLTMCSAITPESTFKWHSNITASQLASLTAVVVGWLAPFLQPQHPCCSISAFETKSEFRWKPWQWLVTTVTTALGKASVDSRRTTVFSLHWSLTVSFYGFKASLLCKV